MLIDTTTLGGDEVTVLRLPPVCSTLRPAKGTTAQTKSPLGQERIAYESCSCTRFCHCVAQHGSKIYFRLSRSSSPSQLVRRRSGSFGLWGSSQASCSCPWLDVFGIQYSVFGVLSCFDRIKGLWPPVRRCQLGARWRGLLSPSFHIELNS